MAVPTYTKTGAKATTTAKLDKAVFGVEVKNHELLKQAYNAYLANGRQNNAVVKTRGLVRGGGRKPWRQKGTGRARFGSIRNPIWRGGGIVFGPSGNENYSKVLNTNKKRTALKQALSIAASNNCVTVIESFESKDGKVASTIKFLDKIGVKGSTLLVVPDKTDMIQRATRNVRNLSVVQAQYLNVFDVVNADTIVVSKDALQVIHEWLGGDK